MPIVDLQRRFRELGRIRSGERVNGKRPTKLDHFRLTSPSRELVEAAGEKYGTDKRGVRPWTNPFDKGKEFEVVVSAETIPILVPPGQSLSQWWELWSGGGCERRCDGQRETLGDRPCLCPPAGKERADAAAGGRACKPTTRLGVILPELPDVGIWRLESHGYHAAVELAGTADLLARATRAGYLIPAHLRLEQRTVKRPGEATRNFAVPVIELPTSSAALAFSNEELPQLTGGERVPPQLPAAPPLPADASFSSNGDAPNEQPEQGPQNGGEQTPDQSPAPVSPGCDHPQDKHQATEAGVVCTDCGELVAARPEEPPPRPRAGSGVQKTSNRVHGAIAKKGLTHDDLHVIAGAVLGIETGDMEAFTLSPDAAEDVRLSEADWAQIEAFIEALPGTVDSEVAAQWAWKKSKAKGYLAGKENDADASWAEVDRLATLATGKGVDDLGAGELIALAVRIGAGEYDPTPAATAS